MINRIMIVVAVSLVVLAIIAIMRFMRPAIAWYREQRDRQIHQFKYEQAKMDIDRVTWDTCQKILDELRQAHLPPDEDWHKWKPERYNRNRAYDEDDPFMSDIPNYGSDEDWSWMDDDLSIPGDDLWGDQR